MWPAPAPEPPPGPALTGIVLFEGWTEPRSLTAPISTVGWEDSAFISADGNQLFFAYSRLDAWAASQNQGLVTGPERPGHHGSTFDIYQANLLGASWDVINSYVNSAGEIEEAAVGVDRDRQTMVFVRFDDGVGDLYWSRWQSGDWGQPKRLPAPVNTQCLEDNPTLSADGLVLYFDSNRADPTGASCNSGVDVFQRSFYVSRYSDGAWSAPVLVEGSPNETPARSQFFISDDGGEAYFTGIDPNGDCDTYGCLYRAPRESDVSFGERTLIAKPSEEATAQSGDVLSLAEASLTADGRFLYFVYMTQPEANRADLSIGVARKLF